MLYTFLKHPSLGFPLPPPTSRLLHFCGLRQLHPWLLSLQHCPLQWASTLRSELAVLLKPPPQDQVPDLGGPPKCPGSGPPPMPPPRTFPGLSAHQPELFCSHTSDMLLHLLLLSPCLWALPNFPLCPVPCPGLSATRSLLALPHVSPNFENHKSEKSMFNCQEAENLLSAGFPAPGAGVELSWLLSPWSQVVVLQIRGCACQWRREIRSSLLVL